MLFFILEKKIHSFGALQDLGAVGARLVRLLVNAPLIFNAFRNLREPLPDSSLRVRD